MEEYLKQEVELIGFKEQGLDIYEPDVAAFRATRRSST